MSVFCWACVCLSLRLILFHDYLCMPWFDTWYSNPTLSFLPRWFVAIGSDLSPVYIYRFPSTLVFTCPSTERLLLPPRVDKTPPWTAHPHRSRQWQKANGWFFLAYLQGTGNTSSHAESHRRLWWRTWPDITSCRKLCSCSRPRPSRRRGCLCIGWSWSNVRCPALVEAKYVSLAHVSNSNVLSLLGGDGWAD
jgi:hypothetical protein